MDTVIVDQRPVVFRTRGRRHGPITRVVSPSGTGALIKPFVFLDYFDAPVTQAPRFGIHPHSGIATITLPIEGDFTYEDTTGKSGVLRAGGVEWMRAGAGVWHDGAAASPGRLRGLQLWIALPAHEERAPAESGYVAPVNVPQDGPVRVILGRYGAAVSAVRSQANLNYLHVRLNDGERWEYQPPAGHNVAWVYVHQGTLRADDQSIGHAELAAFAESESTLRFQAQGDTGFVLGSAVKHPHDLVIGSYSVHTSAEALDAGEAEIRRIGARLRAEGRLSSTSDMGAFS